MLLTPTTVHAGHASGFETSVDVLSWLALVVLVLIALAAGRLWGSISDEEDL